jgi:nucleoside-diphosphate-sugar epimerase
VTDTVLVTGATGFLAQHCIVRLLEAGHVVRGTARGSGRVEEVRRIIAPHVGPAAADRLAHLDVVPADLTSDSDWAEALQGCRFVLHVASPVPRTPPRRVEDLVMPAREGTLRVLRAARAAGVERVVLTSSISAMIYGRPRDHVFTEDDWSDVDGPNIGAYDISKTLAERAAWDFVADGAGPQLVAVNPGLVLGPVLSPDWGTSSEVVRKLISRELPAVPNISFAVVDARDVADAHVRAMTTPQAAGRRFIVADGDMSMREMASILAEHLTGRGFRVPTRPLPTPLMRLVARFDRTIRLALNDVDVRQQVDSSAARSVLGWSSRPAAEAVRATADSLIAHGVVRPGRRTSR